MRDVVINREGKEEKKRGRKSKKKEGEERKEEKSKFFVDLGICEMSLGIVNDQSATIWRKVVVFGKLAELCSVHLRKGNEVFVRGRKELKQFKDREGVEREYFEVFANSIGQSLL